MSRGRNRFSGLDPLIVRVRSLAAIDAAAVAPLMEDLERVIVEDNRKGVLEGTDKDGDALASVTYRAGRGVPTRARAVGKGFGALDRAGWKAMNRAAGVGKGVAAARGNLKPSVYRDLTGPPLAPRGAASRVITHLQTEHHQEGAATWAAVARWWNVASAHGVPFLTAHFEGKRTGKGYRTRLPKRDLRGVRPWGRAAARLAVRRWAAERLAGS